MLPGTWFFKCESKPYWTTRKFKARYCVKGVVQKILYTETLSFYYPVFQWVTVRLLLIFQCILGLQIQSIDFTNAFSQTGITSGEPTSIEFTRDFESDGVQCDVVIRLNKSLSGQDKSSCLCYENL